MRHFLFRKLSLGAPIAALAFATAACAPASPTLPASQTAPESERVLRMGQEASDLGALDLDFASTTPDRAVVDMVYNALVRYTPGDSRTFEPDLPSNLPEPQMVGGKQQWTFNPRRTPISAERAVAERLSRTGDNGDGSRFQSAGRWPSRPRGSTHANRLIHSDGSACERSIRRRC